MSTPLFQEFNPNEVPWQMGVVDYIENYNWDLGVLEILFSGSIGSAKSILAAHIIVRHLLENNGSRCLMLRRALKDLKRTLWSTTLSHIQDIDFAIESYNKSEMRIRFKNGSELIGDSYDKNDLEKFRSLELSMVAVEEASESNLDVYNAVKMRVGRLPSVKENLILSLTNPSEPDHYLYEKIIMANNPRIKVFYSLTEQNKFLPDWYIENLKEDLSPLEAERMLRGKWISIAGEKPYHAYDKEKNYKDEVYKYSSNLPLDLSFDFNIGNGKPMSAMVGQCYRGYYHVARDFIVEGFRTNNMIDEILESGILEQQFPMVRVFGDASGDYRDTRGPQSDFDIILKTLDRYTRKNGTRLIVKKCIARSNPKIRVRQNLVNSKLCNDNKEHRLFIYKDAPMVEKGFRLTKLLKGSRYVEDDTDPWQHVITAVGYWICENEKNLGNKRISIHKRL